MTNELTAAAERLRRITNGEPHCSVYPDDHGQLLDEQDAWVIVRDHLAKHPPDDDTPVDEEWLRAVGFEVTFGGGLIARLPGKRWGLESINAGWILIQQLFHPVTDSEDAMKTRGDVRRLCTALGIELKED